MEGQLMRKSLTVAGLAALVLGAATVPATAASHSHWRVNYVSPDTGDDDFGLYQVAAVGKHDVWAVGSKRQGAGATGGVLRWNGRHWGAVTVPGSTGSFGAVGGSSSKDVWLTGVTANGESTAWHWNGRSWKTVSIDGYDAA